MSGDTPTCQIHNKYPWIECQRDALEGDPYGRCLLHSWQLNKDQEGKFTDAVKHQLGAEDYNFSGVFFPGIADFSEQKFTKMANFSRTTFEEAVNFSDATFSDKASFTGATFSDKASFLGAIFLGGATFSGANFSEEGNFSLATFTGWAKFSDATFSGGATFPGVTFSAGGDFSRAKISGGASFRRSTFFGEVDFSHATFSWGAFSGASIKATGRLLLRFINLPDEKIQIQPLRVDFRFLQQAPGGRVLFQGLSLVQAKFHSTDLRRVEFDRVTWASWMWRSAVYDEIRLHQRRWAHIAYVLNYGWFWGKKIPGDEDRPRKPSYADFAPVERIYRQLKINYEDERDFKRVGDFHYGEMEMHRRGSPWRQWVPFSWHNLYRGLSGYGERPCRALGWLAGFLLALPLLVWGVGLDRVAGGTTPGFLEIFTYIFEKATFQRPLLLSNLNLLGTFISNLSLLIIPGQAALFLLALRNRLGRRR